MPTATPEQEAWTQGYDACRQHVGKQRIPQVKEAIDAVAATGDLTAKGAALLKRALDTIFSDLGFPFAGPDRITELRTGGSYDRLPDSVGEAAVRAGVTLKALGMPYWEAVPGGRKCPSCGEVIPVAGTKLNAAVHEHWATHDTDTKEG